MMPMAKNEAPPLPAHAQAGLRERLDLIPNRCVSRRMHVVLGIDAAWTVTRPSGIAVVAQDGTGWMLIARICAIEGRAKPYGGDQAAIWIPH